MKKATTLLLLLLSIAAVAQRETQDILYLKDGSVIRGQMKQEGDRFRIKLLGGTELVYQQGQIDSMKKEDVRKAQLYDIKHHYYRHDRGYRNMTEFGFIYGTNLKEQLENYYYYYQPTDDVGISLHTMNGYQIWPYLYVGAGVGIERFITYRQTFVPVYLRLSSEFIKRRVTPYVFIDAGYAFMPQDQVTSTDGYKYYNRLGGLYITAGGGLRIYTRSRASLTISAGYKRTNSGNRFMYSYEGSPEYETKRTYQRLVVSFGVSF
jgi:hypothetical protein